MTTRDPAPRGHLTDYQRQVIARARRIAEAENASAAVPGYTDRFEANVAAFTQAQIRISELLNIIEYLTGEAAGQ